MSIGRWLGVEVRVHPGWLLVVALVVVSLAPWLSSQGALGLPSEAAVAVSLLVAAALFLSVLAHELAHALTARRMGVRVPEIWLTVLGGTTWTTSDPRSARVEGLIAASGPVVSAILGAVVLLPALLLPADGELWMRGLRWTILLIGAGNLLLAGLSLVPALPLDGGRAVRALLWGVLGDQVRATRYTSAIGRLIAYGLMFAGFIFAIGGSASQILAGLWLVLIGWYLSRSSRGSYNRVRLEQLVEGMSIGDALERNVAVVGPGLTLDTLIQQHEREGSVRVYPVTVDGGLVGTVDLGRVARIPRRKWPTTRVTDVMRRAESMITFTEPQPLMAAVAGFEQTGADAFPVVDPDDPRRLLGLVTRENTLRLMRSRARRLESTTS
jgi:Zn-dependent protease/CBS domain-containing protein